MLDSRSDPVLRIVAELKLEPKNNPSALTLDFSFESGNLMPTQNALLDSQVSEGERPVE